MSPNWRTGSSTENYQKYITIEFQYTGIKPQMVPRRRKSNLTQRIRNKNIFIFLGSNNFWKKITSNLVLHSVKMSIKYEDRIKTSSYMWSLKFYLLWDTLFRKTIRGYVPPKGEGNSIRRTERRSRNNQYKKRK